MEEVQEQYVELMVRKDQLEAARAHSPLFERELMGRHILLYKGVPRSALEGLGELNTPSVVDLFVATMSAGGAA
jgi:ABC-2 type transport system ATP-binding protein